MATLQPTMHPKPSALLCKLEALEVALDSANNVHQHLHTEVSQLLLELDALRVQKAQYEQHIHDLAAQLNKEKAAKCTKTPVHRQQHNDENSQSQHNDENSQSQHNDENSQTQHNVLVDNVLVDNVLVDNVLGGDHTPPAPLLQQADSSLHGLSDSLHDLSDSLHDSSIPTFGTIPLIEGEELDDDSWRTAVRVAPLCTDGKTGDRGKTVGVAEDELCELQIHEDNTAASIGNDTHSDNDSACTNTNNNTRSVGDDNNAARTDTTHLHIAAAAADNNYDNDNDNNYYSHDQWHLVGVTGGQVHITPQPGVVGPDSMMLDSSNTHAADDTDDTPATQQWVASTFIPPPLDEQDLPEEVLTEDLGWLFDPQWEALRAQANTLGWLIHPNEVHLGDKIGAGAFGTTYKALWRNKTVAVKCVTVHGETAARMFMREVSLLVSVRHPNVLRCFGACLWPAKHCWLITEYMAGGSLHQWMYGSNPHTAGTILKPQRSLVSRLSVALDVARGMEALESATPPVCHRDLKPSNVFVDGNGHAQVADFGLARLLTPGCIASLTGETGTYQYMSPEMVRHEGYDCKTDVYSWGVMLVELVLQRSPFESLYLTPVQIALSVADGKIKVAEMLPRSTNATVTALAAMCTEEEPALRPTFGVIVEEMEGAVAEVAAQQAAAGGGGGVLGRVLWGRRG